MIKFSYFLQVFLQVIFAQIILSSDIFQLRYDDLQSLMSRNSRNFQTLEDVLARDGAFVSTWQVDSPQPLNFPFFRFIQEFNIYIIIAPLLLPLLEILPCQLLMPFSLQAISGLPPDYRQSVIELQSSAPSCLDSSPGDEAVFSLPDGSRRWTWARDNSGQYEDNLLKISIDMFVLV